MPIQLHQNINLAFLLVVGSFVAHIYLGWIDIATILLFAISIEHLFLYFNPNRDFYFSFSAISTAISLTVLMYSSHLWQYLVVLALGLFQKHYLTIEERQFFNPSNFAIIMALLFFYQDAHIISGQFGDELWLGVAVFVIATIMLVRVNRWIISLAFVVSYLLLNYFLIVYYDPAISFDTIYRRFYSVTFMLFIYFMLTDPPVTPTKPIYQAIFGFLVALGAVLLDRFYGFRIQHLFMVVFFLSPFVTIFNSIKLGADGFSLGTKDSIGTKNIVISILVVIFVIGTIIWIEQQPPYYFEMEG